MWQQARKGRQTVVFHTMPEYEEWKESLGAGGTKGWDVKYYKGLGTSTNDEAREYFANINRKEFVWTGARPCCCLPLAATAATQICTHVELQDRPQARAAQCQRSVAGPVRLSSRQLKLESTWQGCPAKPWE